MKLWICDGLDSEIDGVIVMKLMVEGNEIAGGGVICVCIRSIQ